MKIKLFTIMLLFSLSVKSQKRDSVINNYYWTIWFQTTSCEDGYDYQHSDRWVQSYFDSTQSYMYYYKLRFTGKVLIWNKMKCIVDTTTVWIDKYSISLHKYMEMKQPSLKIR